MTLLNSLFTQQRSRYALYQTGRGLFILLDRARAPSLGDLVIIDSGDAEILTHYRGQAILGVATLLEQYE